LQQDDPLKQCKSGG